MLRKTSLLFNLRSRIFMFFGILFMLLFVVSLVLEQFGVPAIGFDGDIATQKKDAFNKLNLIVDLKKDRLSAWLQERLGDVELQADQEKIQSYSERISFLLQKNKTEKIDSEKIKALLRSDAGFTEVTSKIKLILTAYEHPGFYKNATIIDKKTGKIIASANQEYLAMDVSNQDYFKVPLNTSQMFIGIGKDPRSQSSELYIAKPLKKAILAFVINIDAIFKTLSITGNALGKTGDVVIVDNERMVLASLQAHLMPLKDQNIGTPAILASSGKNGAIEGMDYRKVKVLAAYRYLPIMGKMGWGVIVKQDYSEIFDQETKIMFLKFVLNGIVLLIVLIVSAGLAKKLSKPVEDLALVAEEVEKGNYSIRASVNAPGEIGLLAQRMNSMIAGIATRSEKLVRLNSELDERVKIRTAELDAANKELEAFSYSVAHDLRSPLRGMSGFSHALLEDYGDKLDEEGKDYLKRIMAGSNKMAGLIEDLLSLSRISRDEMRIGPTDLSLIAKTIVDELKKQSPHRKVECIIGTTHEVQCDARLIRLALENLLNNAWKFTGKINEAKIEFGETEIEGKTTFYIRDNGVGFDPAHKKMLFLPFHRLHTNAEFDGTGIGLAIVRRVIERHGGKIWGESAPNKGATFYFTI